MRETVKHGETGFLVNSLREMEELVRANAVAGLRPERCREDEVARQDVADCFGRLVFRDAVDDAFENVSARDTERHLHVFFLDLIASETDHLVQR